MFAYFLIILTIFSVFASDSDGGEKSGKANFQLSLKDLRRLVRVWRLCEPMHPCDRALVHPCTRAPVRPCTRASVLLCTRALVHPCTCAPMRPFARTPMRPYKNVRVHGLTKSPYPISDGP